MTGCAALRWRGTNPLCGAWPSTAAASAWRPAVMTAPCACGSSSGLATSMVSTGHQGAGDLLGTERGGAKRKERAGMGKEEREGKGKDKGEEEEEGRGRKNEEKGKSKQRRKEQAGNRKEQGKEW